MKDLTQGSVTRHLLEMSAFIAVSMLIQTLYLLADLYWVGHLGKEAIAAVGLSGNLMMVVLALTQTLGVGTTTIISQATGQKNQPKAELCLNQSLVLSTLVGIGLLVSMFALRDQYCRWLSADAETAFLARQFLLWFIPALMMQFPLVALGSALRATGIMKPTVAIQAFTVLVNMALTPLLMFGVWIFPRLGVVGAALATFVSVVLANVLLAIYFVRNYHYLRFRFSLLGPDPKIWGAMLRIGLPAGGEFALMAVYIVVVYGIIRNFGAAAQAGFGVGVRVMQSMFLPVVAIAFAVAPVVGQNFGGRQADRVRKSFGSALALTSITMVLLTIAAQFVPDSLIRLFSKDADVIAFGGDYLRIISFNFLAAGVVFVSSSVFQGIGNTFPPLVSSMTRLILFALPAVAISRAHGFQIRYVWYLSVASIFLQACVNLVLLRREFGRKLNFEGTEGLSEQPGVP